MFKREKSKKEVGHPVYVYGRRNRFMKYLRFTHEPEKGKESDFEKLRHNIDPDEKGRDSYVRKQFFVRREEDLEPPPKKYRIHPEDAPTMKRFKK